MGFNVGVSMFPVLQAITVSSCAAFLWSLQCDVVVEALLGDAPPPQPPEAAPATNQSSCSCCSRCVIRLCFYPAGSLLATASLDSTVRVWRVSDGSCVQTLEGPGDGVEWVTWHPKGDVVLAGSEDFTLWMWLAQSGNCMQVCGVVLCLSVMLQWVVVEA
jgi:WD40 repeat protein